MPTSLVQQTRRALVTLLFTFARQYDVNFRPITRDSSDEDLLKAFKKVALKVHPDKGGRQQDAQKLNAARDAWEAAKKDGKRGPKPKGNNPDGGEAASADGPGLATTGAKGFRINSLAVLLTYSRIAGLTDWREFLDFVRANLKGV